MIPVEKEPDVFLKEAAEQCVFCSSVSRHWHIKTNAPICEACASVRDVKDIPEKQPHKKAWWE